jgi:Na+-driven multidrug efflux pump
MISLLCASSANIVFDYIFIVDRQMGMFGAALATTLATALGLLVVSTFFIRKKNTFKLIKCSISSKIIKTIFSLGFPSFITEMSAGIVIIVFNIIILGLIGNIGIAAYGVIANISIIVISIYNGLAQGIQPLISRYYGSGVIDNAHKVLKYALITMSVISVVFYVITFINASQITAIFNSEDNPLLYSIAIHGIRIYFLASIFVGFNIILSIYLTSIERPRPAQIISVLRGFLLIIPLAFILSSTLGMTGVWLTFPLTEFLVTCFAITIYLKTRKQTVI